MPKSVSLRSIVLLFTLAGCATTTVASAPAPQAPPPQAPPAEHHPAYLHAMADLRHARAHLERPGAVTMTTAWDENVAIREIDEALAEIRRASIDDGKNLNDHPPVDGALDWPGRLHRSLELLRNARRDCEQEEDNGFAQGLRARAIQHIDGAIRHIEQGIAANYPHSRPPPPIAVLYVPPQPMPAMPAEHPAYLHAIADLRHARAHLERPGAVTMRTAWNEAIAVGEIDGALHEIKEAAIDDGKNLNDHPPVDGGLDWPGRLHRSLELLRNARRDCEQEEDNGFAQGLRARAIQHIDAAIHHIEKGIADNYPHSRPPPPIAVVYVAPAPVAAPPPARPEEHPAYLHAIADLRHARAHLERPGHVTMRTAWNEAVAIGEIDASLHEIKEAAIDDGKPLSDHPPVDGGLDWPGRLHRALELLRNARRDCTLEEDNGFAQGLRARALQHIDAAIHHVEKGIADNFPRSEPPPPIAVVYQPPPPRLIPAAPAANLGKDHPAYLHALVDLRHARAHLERPAKVVKMRVAFDEAIAIREIDAALHEIKEAAIDDGKNLEDHPPVQAKLAWPGRLHKTVALLKAARQDIAKEEDNGFARGLQARAYQHIDAAIAFVQKGIKDNHF